MSICCQNQYHQDDDVHCDDDDNNINDDDDDDKPQYFTGLRERKLILKEMKVSPCSANRSEIYNNLNIVSILNHLKSYFP